MDFLVRMLQQMGNVVETASLFESTGRAGKADRPVVAFMMEGIRDWHVWHPRSGVRCQRTWYV